MKLKQYLTEELQSGDIIKVLEKECQPYIKDLVKTGFGNQQLYRGVKQKFDFEKVFVKQDRRPKDSPQGLHDALDEMFKEKFNLELRSKTVFTTANNSNALDYGSLYMVFPIGKYEIYWSSKVEDFYQDVNDAKMNIEQFQHGEMTGREMTVSLMDFFVESPQEMSQEEKDYHYEDARLVLFAMVNTFKKGNLKAAIRSRNEVMVYCRSVYMVSGKYRMQIMDYFKNYDKYQDGTYEMRYSK